MADIVTRALALVAIVGIGLGIKRLGWVTKDQFGLFARLVLGITLPCALFTAFNDYHLEYALLGLTVLALVINVGQQAIGYLLASRRGRREQAFAVLNSGSYNIGAFATPYLAGFMGPHAMVYSTLFDFGTAFSAAGVGYGWGMALAGEPGSFPLARHRTDGVPVAGLRHLPGVAGDASARSAAARSGDHVHRRRWGRRTRSWRC